ncbi:hypothetical protein [uncultured Bacteroides sp.]|uniref:tetratricopeptide repeat protein n=2 Tax=uncultured Bacteroides sp. TaxID=162156 RepID=UPI0025E000DD|nr:hypothetical protein [uncultured Bacteroides sp.]
MRSFSMRSLLMFSVLFVGIGSVLSSVCLFSCSSSVKNPVLLSADSLMETRPDSALSILESISSPQKLTRAERAYYAVLLTQAKHKNVIPLEDDSLIKTAVEYYGDRKKSINAARAHYYLGATYCDKGSISFAVDEYLTAIRLMPVKNEFLAMVYDNLAECYEEDGLGDVAMETYRSAYQILKGKSDQAFPLRGIAHIFLLQNKKDSALCYYYQALSCAMEDKDFELIGALYHDLAMVYNDEKDYVQADKYISKAITTLSNEKLAYACLSKAKIQFNLNRLDSASYYYSKDLNQLDIYGKAVSYDGMYNVAKKKGDWKTAMENLDTYKMLYDSIQTTLDNEELTRLMDKHQLEEHKRLLTEHNKTMLVVLISAFLALLIISSFCIMWIDRKRKKRYIDLQKELNQNRVNTMLLDEKESSMSEQESINEMKLDLINQRLKLCSSLFQPSDCYKKLEAMKKATPKQMLDMHHLVTDIKNGIMETFVDVMTSLSDSGEKNLTSDDKLYCMLVLLQCSKPVIMELMGDTSDAIKTRKNRIKNKMDAQLFNFVFNSNNQNDRVN